MFTRTIAASVLALGLLSPIVASAQGMSAEPNYACSQDTNQHADYGDCNVKTGTSGSAAFAAAGDAGVKGPIGDFIDETAQDKNQRSSKN